MLLSGDLGGTTTRLGLFESVTSRPAPRHTREFRTTDHAGLSDLLRAFLDEAPLDGQRIEAACVGVAGPVLDGRATLTNVPWPVGLEEIRDATSIDRAALINDVEAMGYALPVLTAAEVEVLQAGEPDPGGNAVLLTAGTGLGVSLLRGIGGRLEPLASEGGHTDFAARDEAEIALVRYLLAAYGRAEAEQVVSGPGLVNIARHVHPDDCPVNDLTGADRDLPPGISRGALDGTCRFCVEALTRWVAAFGSVAGNFALSVVATGGVYLGGGIPPRILPALRDGTFVRAFREKPPMDTLLARIPITVILEPQAGLLGAAVRAAQLVL